MATQLKTARRRLNPDTRRALILDEAARIVAREGVADLSIELISRQCGISKSLVYNYFPNLTILLQMLLERELRHLRRLQFEAVERAETLEMLVRSVTHVYLRYISERGLIIERLQNEPSVSHIHDPTGYGRDAAVDYLASIIGPHLALPNEVIRAATDISFGLPAFAGSYLLRHDTPLELVEDLTVTMIMGSLMQLQSDYAARRQPLPLHGKPAG